MSVAIYDSGVGGLSIYREIKRAGISSDCLFVSDNQGYPYGTKPEGELLDRVLKVTQAIVATYSPSVLVIACNTASTVCLPHLRNVFNMPIVGVVPAIKPAASLSRSKTIGLIATPATVRRAYTQSLIDEFAEDCRVIKLGTSELVDMAEAKLRGESIDQDDLERILEPLIAEKNIDVVVLACTHFPLLSAEILSVFERHAHSIQLVDSGTAIARRVQTVLGEQVADTRPYKDRAAFTSLNQSKTFRDNLKSMGFDRIEELSV